MEGIKLYVSQRLGSFSSAGLSIDGDGDALRERREHRARCIVPWILHLGIALHHFS